jgi:hypothetical protein
MENYLKMLLGGKSKYVTQALLYILMTAGFTLHLILSYLVKSDIRTIYIKEINFRASFYSILNAGGILQTKNLRIISL